MKDALPTLIVSGLGVIVYLIGRAIRSLGYHYIPADAFAGGKVVYEGFAGFIGVLIMWGGIFLIGIGILAFLVNAFGSK